MRSPSITEFSVGWICALPKELTAARVMLDEEYDGFLDRPAQDPNSYVVGRLHGHNVVMACLPAGRYGTTSAATVASNMLRTFPGIQIGLMVGIGAGVPNLTKGYDVRLGDVVVSHSDGLHPGVVQYDLGKNLGESTFELKGYLHGPPTFLLTALANLQSQFIVRGNNVFSTLEEVMNRVPQLASHGYAYAGSENDVLHCAYLQRHQVNTSCDACCRGLVERRPRPDFQPIVHFGTIASGNELIKNAAERDRIGSQLDAKCIEMEAAGLMNDFPCLVIRGICDYADIYKNDMWQEYAAITAAAFTRNLLQIVKPIEVTRAQLTARSTVATPPMNGFELGLNLFDAPDIDRDLFIGRESELQLMEETVRIRQQSRSSGRNILILGGPGGIGKTQRSLAFAHRHRNKYQSIFWLNALSKGTLHASLQRMAEYVFEDADKIVGDHVKVLLRIKRWLSMPDNSRWLLIFDNYDAPDAYSLHDYYPHASHGTIVVTTRQPSLVNGREILVQPLRDFNQEMLILETRSRRTNLKEDEGARRLVQRLAGLPLALATAGAYLQHSTLTFQQYFEAYEQQWQSSNRGAVQLFEYQDRTLYTTWNLSYQRLKQKDKDAAQFLGLLAYFDPQSLWYELFAASNRTDLPQWLSAITSTNFNFDSAMQILAQYCLVEVQPSTHTYSIHPCVHDWIVSGLSDGTDADSYWYAFDCVAGLVTGHDRVVFGNSEFARIVPHAERLTSSDFKGVGGDALMARITQADQISKLLKEQFRIASAEALCQWALMETEKALGPAHLSTLLMVHSLGDLRIKQKKYIDAEQCFLRALAGREKTLGPSHTLTLDTVHNLGLVYTEQEKYAEGEEMYKRALTGTEGSLGRSHTSTLITMSGLSDLYMKQQKMAEAEGMFRRTLAGCEQNLGPDHTLTLDTVHNLGNVCVKLSLYDEAEKLFLRALAGREQSFGPEHAWTLDTVQDLAHLYGQRQGYDKAESLFQRALAGHTKAKGADGLSALSVYYDLAIMYSESGRHQEAEVANRRALDGYMKHYGPEHATTLSTIFNLAYLLTDLQKLGEAEQMYIRALTGYNKVRGPDHSSTINSALNLGLIYADQRRFEEAKPLYEYAVAGRMKHLGIGDAKTLSVISNLSTTYSSLGKHDVARQLDAIKVAAKRGEIEAASIGMRAICPMSRALQIPDLKP